MDILVFTDSLKVKESFAVKRRTQLYNRPVFLSRREFSKILPTVRSDALIYLDISGLGQGEISNRIRLLEKKESHFAVIDPTNRIKDAAGIFHRGAVDYVNRQVLQEGITPVRLKSIVTYIQSKKKQHTSKSMKQHREPEDGSIVTADWQTIVPGNEYTFYLMFIELDGKEDMEKKYGRTNLKRALSSVRNYIENSVRLFNGRIWLWSNFGGVILFPFDEAKCKALRFGFRFMLFKHFYDIEESQFPNFLSFRIALHIGSMLYSEKNKGQIVSDSLNTVFHLGQQFTEPGNFYITSEVLKAGGNVFKGYFIDAGAYEERRIFRMRHPLHSGRAIQTF